MKQDNNFIQNAVKTGGLRSETITILCVDDEVFNLDIMEKHLKKAAYHTILAENGQQAIDILEKDYEAIDVVLLDRMMPGIDGMGVLQHIKSSQKLAHLPVIMQTAAGGDTAVKEGIDAGAYYYVTKPYNADVLLSIVSAATKEKRQLSNLGHQLDQQHQAYDLINHVSFALKTHANAAATAPFIASFSKHPRNIRNIIMAFNALCANAIEHGNYAIGREAKGEALIDGAWHALIRDRAANPTYAAKTVAVTMARDKNGEDFHVTIKDEGQGFRWRDYVDFDPTRMTDPNGRGVALAHAHCPGCIRFNNAGNEVTLTIKNKLDENAG